MLKRQASWCVVVARQNDLRLKLRDTLTPSLVESVTGECAVEYFVGRLQGGKSAPQRVSGPIPVLRPLELFTTLPVAHKLIVEPSTPRKEPPCCGIKSMTSDITATKCGSGMYLQRQPVHCTSRLDFVNTLSIYSPEPPCLSCFLSKQLEHPVVILLAHWPIGTLDIGHGRMSKMA